MPIALVLLLAAGVSGLAPLQLDATREPAAVEVTFRLQQSLPAELAAAIDSGAEVRLVYPMRVRASRRGWWDRRVWAGELVTIATFDPVTGRYRCELVLDGVITASSEVDSAQEARLWLEAPPPMRVELPESRRQAHLKVRVRVVFSSGTKWLIFPTQNATPWAEIDLPLLPETQDRD